MSDVLDMQVLDDLVEHIGAEAAQAVIALFLEECRDLAAAITAPGAAPAAVARAAHSLKSSAGQLGAAALSEAALAVETAANARSLELPSLVARLSTCAAATRKALEGRLS
ncbi:MAG TPA: Hpt domain-containing protein [Stellaceae bacterium]|nr:Hpt domain-containing protein [Stellaceae bacterium]